MEVPADLAYARVFLVAVVSLLDRFDFCIADVKRGCVHVVTPEGKIIPLDTYNLSHREGRHN